MHVGDAFRRGSIPGGQLQELREAEGVDISGKGKLM